MQTVLKICNKCGRYIGSCSPDAKIHGGTCGGELIDTGISHDELMVIRKISSDNTFLDAMIELKKDDIIEYNLKLSQFRNQTNSQNQDNNLLKCPICNSTKIKKISIGTKVTKTVAFGILGAVDDAGKTYKCETCGSKF